MSTHTYKQSFSPDTLVSNMARESGRLYSKAMLLNKVEHKSFKEITKIMELHCKTNCKYLQSQSAQASYQNFIVSLKTYFKALATYKKNPSGFSGKPKPPHRKKFLYKITFKKSAIRRKDNYLLLSTKKPYEPIRVEWAIINYDRFEGWSINFIMEKEYVQLSLDPNKIMAIDLGVKRVATTFDGENTTTYNGKILMSLNRLRNKVDGKIKEKISKFKRGSRKHKQYQRVKRKIIRRIKNREKDILHKYSAYIVEDAISKKIGKIVIGNNSSTHNETDTGKQNQKIQQNPEQQLRKYVQYKFERVSGTTEVVPEPYTSRTCPLCDNVKSSSPKGRDYTCSNHTIKCVFAFDRDGVGAINQYRNALVKNVSFDHDKWLNVVGGLTPPRGVKYTSQLSLISRNRNKILDDCCVLREPVVHQVLSKRVEEPHVL